MRATRFYIFSSSGRGGARHLQFLLYNNVILIQVAEFLLEQGADVNAQDKGGLIPLHNASSYGHLDIAALLIKYSTIVNATGQSFYFLGSFGTLLGHYVGLV